MHTRAGNKSKTVYAVLLSPASTTKHAIPFHFFASFTALVSQKSEFTNNNVLRIDKNASTNIEEESWGGTTFLWTNNHACMNASGVCVIQSSIVA